MKLTFKIKYMASRSPEGFRLARTSGRCRQRRIGRSSSCWSASWWSRFFSERKWWLHWLGLLSHHTWCIFVVLYRVPASATNQIPHQALLDHYDTICMNESMSSYCTGSGLYERIIHPSIQAVKAVPPSASLTRSPTIGRSFIASTPEHTVHQASSLNKIFGILKDASIFCVTWINTRTRRLPKKSTSDTVLVNATMQ